jgi:hypothetical protein
MSGDNLTPLQRASLRHQEAVREAKREPGSIKRLADLRDATNAVRGLLAEQRKKRRK